jgi:hypothetical protein
VSGVSLASTLAREPGIVARCIAGETILVPVTRRAQEMGLFTLNEVGTFVWDRLDGARSLDAIADEMTARFEVTRERAAGDLLDFTRRLAEAGCVGEVAS